jgi:hypothetical protein
VEEETETKPCMQTGALVTARIPAMHFSKRRKGRSDIADGARNEAADGGMESDGRAMVALRGSSVDARAHPLPSHGLEDGRHGDEEKAVDLTQYAGMLRAERLVVQRLRMERDSKAAEVEALRACLLEATNLAAVTTHHQQQIETAAKQFSMAGTTASLDEVSAVEVEAIKQQKDALEIKLRAQSRDLSVLRAQLDVVEARAAAERARAASADEITKIHWSNWQSQLGLAKAQVRDRLNSSRCFSIHHLALSWI